MRKNLIVVRAGDSSLHTVWLNHKNRNWDLVLSYYGDDDHPHRGHFDLLHRCKGTKWEGIVDFLQTHEHRVAEYEYVWFPDDDIFTSGTNIDAFFTHAKSFGLDICQPALHIYSYVSHGITLHRPCCDYRTTNFVEIMAPCFSSRALPLLRQTFSENRSGWGLEWLWESLARKHRLHMGIVDLTPVFHTRPVGSAGHGGAQSPHAEMKQLLSRHNLTRFMPATIRHHDRHARKRRMWDGMYSWVNQKLLKYFV